MEWSIEYRKHKHVPINYYKSYEWVYDFTSCKNCKDCILMDELIEHVICNSDVIYGNILYTSSDKNINNFSLCRCSRNTPWERKVIRPSGI